MICPKCKLDTLNVEKDMVVCSKCGFEATLLEYNVWKKAKPQRLSSFQGFLRAMFKYVSKTPRETVEGTSKGFQCPKCGRSMLKGYLVSSGRIIWSDNITLARATNPLMQFGLGRIRGGFFQMFQQPFGLEAYRCRICGIVYIDDFNFF